MKITCPDCKGKGTVERLDLGILILDDDSNNVIRVQCDTCQGTGKINDPTEDITQSNLPEFKW
jgi:DnaJ-class molecular chaperone